MSALERQLTLSQLSQQLLAHVGSQAVAEFDGAPTGSGGQDVDKSFWEDGSTSHACMFDGGDDIFDQATGELNQGRRTEVFQVVFFS